VQLHDKMAGYLDLQTSQSILRSDRPPDMIRGRPLLSASKNRLKNIIFFKMENVFFLMFGKIEVVGIENYLINETTKIKLLLSPQN
jgi:hypothetical protein